MNKLPERVRIKDIAKLANVSVGTVDRVLHGRSGVSEDSRKKVGKILKNLDYQPNMYASALASNKKYLFVCFLPQHNEGDYWTAVEKGLKKAVCDFSDFHITLSIMYYDQYDFNSFLNIGKKILDLKPDGIVVAPTISDITTEFISKVKDKEIPYIFIDSNIDELNPLAFYGQNSRRSGYFAARMSMLLGQRPKKIVVFRQINEGRLGSNQQSCREEGFREYMKENFSECNITELNLSAKSLVNNDNILEDFFKENPDITCGITFNSKVYIIGEYLEKNKISNFKIIGYDLLDRNIACLREGSVDFLIVQQPTIQGYNSIESLCNYLIFKKDIKQCNYMPITLLNIDNIDFYIEAHNK